MPAIAPPLDRYAKLITDHDEKKARLGRPALNRGRETLVVLTQLDLALRELRKLRRRLG
jgi:hypothetical protein